MNWTAPTDLGPPASYLITATPSGGGATTTCTKLSTDPANCTITGLDVTRTYTFTIKAINAAGESSVVTAAETFIPNTPIKPTDVTVVLDPAVPGKATVTWIQPSGGAAVTGWTVTPTSVDGEATVAPCTRTAMQTTECVFTGLTTIASYSFVVRANNAAGGTDSDPTNPMVANRPNPTGPPMVEPIAADRVRISWTAPIGGAVVTKYTVDAPAVPINSTPCTDVVGLSCEFDTLSETESYTFKVTAIGAGGSAVSEASLPMTMAGPGQPGLPTVELAGPFAVQVTWTAPETGGPVLGYTVTSNPPLSVLAGCTNTLALSCTFDRLDSGVEYTFAVIANGSVGRTATSDDSEPIIPGPPGIPRQVAAMPTEDDTQVLVRWDAPLKGGELLGYEVESEPGQLGCTEPAGPDVNSCLVSGLDPTTPYQFRVRALGPLGGGDSPLSMESQRVVPGAPPTPMDVEVAPGNRQIAWPGRRRTVSPIGSTTTGRRPTRAASPARRTPMPRRSISSPACRT